MFIEELVIDGFKSYATRTEISGWDKQFNAITGMNGSGKSNIFDAIIFVLGTTQWTQLRAQTVNNLVYKDGQTDVRKASVTLVFNNKDKNVSPVGYEKFDQITVTRQVVIGGRCKYLLNGHTAQPERINNLFRSVQLNMKNPHFLIMQGRISKVLNMKPLEILGMVEEAAGTKLYEDKKANSLTTLRKKDAKVQEINLVLREQINPTLERLEAQQSQYVSWLKNKTEFDQLEKFRIAYQYVESTQLLNGSKTELKDYEKKIASLEALIESSQAELKQNKAEIAELTAKRENEISGEVHDLQQIVDEASKELVKRKAAYTNLAEDHKREEKKLQDLLQNQTRIQESIEKAKVQIQEHQAELEASEQQAQEKKEQLHNLKLQYQAVSVGVVAGGEGTGKTLADQIMETKKEETTSDTEAQSCQARITHAKKQLEQSQKDVKKSNAEYNSLKAEEAKLEGQLAAMTKELESINFSEENFDALHEKKRNLTAAIRQAEERVNSLKFRMAHIEFRYKPPTPDFPKEKVHGRVASLVTLKDGQFATALDIAAGGKLHNVVVENEQVSKALLDAGLKQRTTFIPLNKINPKVLQKSQIQAAYKQVGQEKVSTALSLVEFDHSNKPAIEYVLGTTLVCFNGDDAKRVTFHKDVKTRTVTIEGDLFDPAGTLTGGSKPTGSAVLQQLHEIHLAEIELNNLKQEFTTTNNKINKMMAHQEKYQELKQKVDLKEREITLLKQRIERTPHFQLIAKVESLETQIKTETLKMEQAQQRNVAAKAKILELQDQQLHFNKKDQLAKTQKNIDATKRELNALIENAKTAQQDQVRLQSEEEQLEEEAVALKEQITAQEADVAKYKKALEKRQKQADKQEIVYNKCKAALDAKQRDCLVADSHIGELISVRDTTLKSIADAEINVKKLNHKIQSFHQAKAKAAKTVAQLKKENRWIEIEEQFFGKENSEYDFQKRDIHQVIEQLRKLEAEQEYLSKRVNNKSLHMFEQAQEEFRKLQEKKTLIENDKAKIVHFIEEWDKKKNIALVETYTKVNSDFGKIFSTLLPGAKAELVQEGPSVLDGLRIRVALGAMWKDNLTELSGGQRSLLALSLVLALLLVKPAPMYILDEIDSALDLSHTQNIGEMLKKNFSQSQFLIISLKEGMFNNANVLFKVKNVNGASQVSRVDNRLGQSRMIEANKDKDNEQNPKKRKRKDSS